MSLMERRRIMRALMGWRASGPLRLKQLDRAGDLNWRCRKA